MGEDLEPCPNCKRNVSRANFTVHSVHCQRNIISCSLCKESLPRNLYQQHVESAHSSIKCQLCGTQVESVKVVYHESTLCPKRLLVCQYCELEITAGEFDKHTEFCGARTDRCKGCTKYVQFKHLQFHYEHDHKYLNPEDKEKAEVNGSEGEEGEECPICLGPVTLPLTLECGHMFCMVCVKGIANTTKNCAICRRDIQRDMLMDIRFCREEDIIKNYVNNPKYKKRSKSVPSRRVGVTTEDYDNMVSALLSSRTSSSSYRYQRPNNGHTPPSYTPYCYTASESTTITTTTQSSIKSSTNTTSCLTNNTDDDCCSSKTSSSISKCANTQSVVPPPRTNSASSRASAPRSSSALPTVRSTNSSQIPQKKEEPKRSYSTLPTATEDRPKRPTSLALQTSDNISKTSSNAIDSQRSEPHHLSQEEYDRWFAFQLAQAEDEMSSAEFNRTQRNPFRRSRSMPERNDESTNFVPNVENSLSPSMNCCEESRTEIQSRLPPTSPRCTTSTSSSTNTFSFSSSSRGSSLSKSSSDSRANENSSSSTSVVTSTGARPKSSTGLKKRVSFKDETPRVKRQAPVMLPCEFCDEVFPERDLMRHQTSCDQNETKNPREYLLSRRSSVTSPVTSPTSPIPSISNSFNSSNIVALSRPPSGSSSTGNSESPTKPTSQLKTLRTPPPSPSLRSRPSQPPTSPPRSPSSSTSPQLTNNLSENCYSPLNSRHASISPGPGVSVSSSSGISSGLSSITSSPVSSTPSTSSSASPIPATTQPGTPGTPTDIEVDFEDEESAFSRPRKGRLISSAITSWRSISGSKPKDSMKYARSNTAPIEIFVDTDVHSPGIITCHSAIQMRAPRLQDESDEETETLDKYCAPAQLSSPVFRKNKNKYPAPPPPQNTNNENRESLSSIFCRKEPQKQAQEYKHDNQTQSKEFKTNSFKFDSFPLMNGGIETNKHTDVIPCEFCKEVFPPDKFQAHQAVCEEDEETSSQPNHSKAGEQREEKEKTPNIPARRNKGPAPKPPSEAEPPRRKLLERSHSVRESSSESRGSKEFESSGRSLERAGSIKETSRLTSKFLCDSPPRKWLSREGFYGSSLDCSAAYSAGGSLTSSTTSINSYTGGHGWSSHVNMIREEARSRRTSYIFSGNSPTTPFFGATRYRDRSSSRHNRSSLYASSICSVIYI